MRQSATKEIIKTVTWNKDLTVGATLEGKYISSESFEGKYGETIKYIIKAQDGTDYGVFGSASINRQFANIPVGAYVWITYQGEEPTKSGRTVKVYNIEFDDEV